MASDHDPRHLGAFDIGCVVVGGIIGVGIFFTPAKVAQAVDSPAQVMLAWGVGGLLAVLGALVFAELSTIVPGHGGVFRYILTAFGRLPAFLYGWANWLVIQAGALGVVALVLADHLDLLCFGHRSLSADAKVAIAVLAMLLFTGTNVLGLRVGKRVQNFLTVLKVAALLFLVALTFVASDGPPTAAQSTSGTADRGLLAGLAAAILPVLFATGGWQQGSFLAGAARRPLRDMPLGILGGVAVVVVAYLSVNLAYLDLLGFERARTESAIGAAAAGVALGEAGGRVFAAMVVLSAAGIMNTICMAPPYVLLAMAREGVFPAAFGRLSARHGTPVLGVLGQGLWAVLLLLLVHAFTRAQDGDGILSALGFLVDGVVFVDWLFFALCGLAALRLRSRPGGFRAPGGAIMAGLFAAGALAVTAGAIAVKGAPSAAGGAVVALGLPVFLLLRKRGGAPPTASAT